MAFKKKAIAPDVRAKIELLPTDPFPSDFFASPSDKKLQTAGINLYDRDGSTTGINAVLREQATNMDRHTSDFNNQSNYDFVRSLQSDLEIAPTKPQITYRGMVEGATDFRSYKAAGGSGERLAESIGLRPDRTFYDKAFMATTPNRDYADRYGKDITLEVMGSAGYKMPTRHADMGGEVLYPAGNQFDVENYRLSGEKLTARLVDRNLAPDEVVSLKQSLLKPQDFSSTQRRDIDDLASFFKQAKTFEDAKAAQSLYSRAADLNRALNEYRASDLFRAKGWDTDEYRALDLSRTAFAEDLQAKFPLHKRYLPHLVGDVPKIFLKEERQLRRSPDYTGKFQESAIALKPDPSVKAEWVRSQRQIVMDRMNAIDPEIDRLRDSIFNKYPDLSLSIKDQNLAWKKIEADRTLALGKIDALRQEGERLGRFYESIPSSYVEPEIDRLKQFEYGQKFQSPRTGASGSLVSVDKQNAIIQNIDGAQKTIPVSALKDNLQIKPPATLTDLKRGDGLIANASDQRYTVMETTPDAVKLRGEDGNIKTARLSDVPDKFRANSLGFSTPAALRPIIGGFAGGTIASMAFKQIAKGVGLDEDQQNAAAATGGLIGSFAGSALTNLRPDTNLRIPTAGEFAKTMMSAPQSRSAGARLFDLASSESGAIATSNKKINDGSITNTESTAKPPKLTSDIIADYLDRMGGSATLVKPDGSQYNPNRKGRVVIGDRMTLAEKYGQAGDIGLNNEFTKLPEVHARFDDRMTALQVQKEIATGKLTTQKFFEVPTKEIANQAADEIRRSPEIQLGRGENIEVRKSSGGFEVVAVKQYEPIPSRGNTLAREYGLENDATGRYVAFNKPEEAYKAPKSLKELQAESRRLEASGTKAIAPDTRTEFKPQVQEGWQKLEVPARSPMADQVMEQVKATVDAPPRLQSSVNTGGFANAQHIAAYETAEFKALSPDEQAKFVERRNAAVAVEQAKYGVYSKVGGNVDPTNPFGHFSRSRHVDDGLGMGGDFGISENTIYNRAKAKFDSAKQAAIAYPDKFPQTALQNEFPQKRELKQMAATEGVPDRLFETYANAKAQELSGTLDSRTGLPKTARLGQEYILPKTGAIGTVESVGTKGVKLNVDNQVIPVEYKTLEKLKYTGNKQYGFVLPELLTFQVGIMGGAVIGNLGARAWAKNAGLNEDQQNIAAGVGTVVGGITGGVAGIAPFASSSQLATATSRTFKMPSAQRLLASAIGAAPPVSFMQMTGPNSVSGGFEEPKLRDNLARAEYKSTKAIASQQLDMFGGSKPPEIFAGSGDSGKFPLKKIISGGQTGADQVGLEVAKQFGIDTGGFAPPRFMTEAGQNMALRDDYGLTEGKSFGNVSAEYAQRTRQNARAADGTVIFADKTDSKGFQRTVKEVGDRPLLVNPESPQQLRDFIQSNRIETLNVAGNRASSVGKDFPDRVRSTLTDAIAPVLPTVDESLKGRTLVTGKGNIVQYEGGKKFQLPDLSIRQVDDAAIGRMQMRKYGDLGFSTPAALRPVFGGFAGGTLGSMAFKQLAKAAGLNEDQQNAASATGGLIGSFAGSALTNVSANTKLRVPTAGEFVKIITSAPQQRGAGARLFDLASSESGAIYTVGGSRKLAEAPEIVNDVLRKAVAGDATPYFVLGDAKGGDAIAKQFAIDNNIPFRVMPADRTDLGNARFVLRDYEVPVAAKQIAATGAYGSEIKGVYISADASKGTQHMVNSVVEAGIPTQLTEVKTNIPAIPSVSDPNLMANAYQVPQSELDAMSRRSQPIKKTSLSLETDRIGGYQPKQVPKILEALNDETTYRAVLGSMSVADQERFNSGLQAIEEGQKFGNRDLLATLNKARRDVPTLGGDMYAQDARQAFSQLDDVLGVKFGFNKTLKFGLNEFANSGNAKTYRVDIPDQAKIELSRVNVDGKSAFRVDNIVAYNPDAVGDRFAIKTLGYLQENLPKPVVMGNVINEKLGRIFEKQGFVKQGNDYLPPELVTVKQSPTLAELTGDRFVSYHGSSSPVADLKNDFFNKDNIYGNGFYTTQDKSIAETYRVKGASTDSGKGYLYEVEAKNRKLFNLDDAISPQIKDAVISNAADSGRLAVLHKEAERLINGGKSVGLGGKAPVSTTELFDGVRKFSKRVQVEIGEDGYAKFVDSFKPSLQKEGYVGFTHEGGVLIKGKRHQVDIFWEPETSVKLTQLDGSAFSELNIVKTSPSSVIAEAPKSAPTLSELTGDRELTPQQFAEKFPDRAKAMGRTSLAEYGIDMRDFPETPKPVAKDISQGIGYGALERPVTIEEKKYAANRQVEIKSRYDNASPDLLKVGSFARSESGLTSKVVGAYPDYVKLQLPDGDFIELDRGAYLQNYSPDRSYSDVKPSTKSTAKSKSGFMQALDYVTDALYEPKKSSGGFNKQQPKQGTFIAESSVEAVAKSSGATTAQVKAQIANQRATGQAPDLAKATEAIAIAKQSKELATRPVQSKELAVRSLAEMKTQSKELSTRVLSRQQSDGMIVTPSESMINAGMKQQRVKIGDRIGASGIGIFMDTAQAAYFLTESAGRGEKTPVALARAGISVGAGYATTAAASFILNPYLRTAAQIGGGIAAVIGADKAIDQVVGRNQATEQKFAKDLSKLDLQATNEKDQWKPFANDSNIAAAYGNSLTAQVQLNLDYRPAARSLANLSNSQSIDLSRYASERGESIQANQSVGAGRRNMTNKTSTVYRDRGDGITEAIGRRRAFTDTESRVLALQNLVNESGYEVARTGKFDPKLNEALEKLGYSDRQVGEYIQGRSKNIGNPQVGTDKSNQDKAREIMVKRANDGKPKLTSAELSQALSDERKNQGLKYGQMLSDTAVAGVYSGLTGKSLTELRGNKVGGVKTQSALRIGSGIGR